MPIHSPAAALKSLVAKLQKERAEHAGKIAEIDAMFSGLGIGGSATPAAKRGRPAGSVNKAKAKGGRRRKRGKFSVSGDESVIAFIKSKGKATSKDVNQHWTGEGRKGKADNALGKLVKAKKLKRSKVKGERGGTYQVA